jgi:hypothetical protein
MPAQSQRPRGWSVDADECGLSQLPPQRVFERLLMIDHGQSKENRGDKDDESSPNGCMVLLRADFFALTCCSLHVSLHAITRVKIGDCCVLLRLAPLCGKLQNHLQKDLKSARRRRSNLDLGDNLFAVPNAYMSTIEQIVSGMDKRRLIVHLGPSTGAL